MSLLEKIKESIKGTKLENEDPKLHLIVYLLAQLYIYNDVYQEVVDKYGKDYVHSMVVEEIERSKGE